MKKFNSAPLEPYFLAYKKDPTTENLEVLFEYLIPIVTEVVNNIAKNFKHTHREDFEDFLQVTKMDIFVYLPKICSISLDVEQLVRIIVSASVFRFRYAYRSYKSKTPVVFYDVQLIHAESDWVPEHANIPVMYSIPSFEEKIDSNNYSDKVLHKSIYNNVMKEAEVRPSQELNIYINTFQSRLFKKVRELNRFKEHEEAIIFCVEKSINSSQPSKKMFKHVFDVHSNYSFIINYADVLLKMAIFFLLQEDRGKIFTNA